VQDDEIEEERSSSRSSGSSTPAAANILPYPRARSRGSSAASFSDLNGSTMVYAPRKICLLSYWPFLGNFCQYLEELYRHARSTSRIPLERLILQLWETPLPGSGRMRVQLEMGGSYAASSSSALLLHSTPHGRVIVFDRPMPDDFPLANFPLTLLFRTLSLSNVLILLSAVLQEKKVIITSKVLPLLTYVAETVRTLIFPLKWMHPYIPILPAPLSGMLDAPMPIFVGVGESFIDSRVLTGDDLVIVYLDRDEIKIGGNGKDAYSTNSLAHAASNAAAVAKDHSNASSVHSSSHSAHLTMLPRKLLQRLVHELRAHTNVTRLKKFSSRAELEAYFHCFRGTTTVSEEPEEEDVWSEDGGRSRSGSESSVFNGPTSASSNLLAIRACFLHVFVTLLGGMDAHLRFPNFEKGATHSFVQLFDLRSFLERSESKSRPFLRTLVDTQMFNYYVEEKTDCTDPSRAIELAFFAHAQKYELELEASIEAVKKRGGITAQSAPQLGVVLYLSQMGSNYTTYTVPSPDTSGLVDMIYSYAEFPRQLDISLLRRPIAVDVPSPPLDGLAVTSIQPEAAIDAAAIAIPPSPVRSLSDASTEGVVLYTPVRAHQKSASSGAPSTAMLNGATNGPSSAARHIKSMSSGNWNGPMNGLSQTTVPRSMNGSARPPSMNGHPNGNQTNGHPNLAPGGGSRMFTGSRGPTTVFRSGPSSTAPSQQERPPEKKDTLTSIIDFLTTVRHKVPPPPSPAQRAPSTPQRGQPQRQAPGSAQRAPPSASRVLSMTSTGQRPTSSNPGSFAATARRITRLSAKVASIDAQRRTCNVRPRSRARRTRHSDNRTSRRRSDMFRQRRGDSTNVEDRPASTRRTCPRRG
jgi:hypothetical protein